MKIYRPSFGLVAACAIALSLASPAAAKDKWINLRTKNFNIVSNAGEDDTRKVALKMEQFCAVTSKLFNIKSVSPVPVTVLVFKSDGSFKPFKPLYNGKPANVAGYFQRDEDENMIALNVVGGEERPFAVIFHEYTHLLTAYTSRQWPPWMAEGFAEFYSTFEVEKNNVKIGQPISNHVYLLRDNKFVPLKTLFQVTHESPEYNERNKQGIFYAESWALIHYLMMGNNRARVQQLGDFFKRFESGADVEQAFTEAFKTDTASMEKELRKYIGNSSYQFLVFTPQGVEGEREMTVKPMADAEVQFYLGNLLLHTNRVDEAETFFKQAAALDPNIAGPYEGLGFVAMRRDKYSEAKEQFKQASALGSQNHLAHYYYAQALQRELAGSSKTISIIHPDMAKMMIDELKASIKIMPGFAPAYDMLGFVYFASGENLKEGERVLRQALQLEPQNKRFALNLAQVQLRMQNYDAARKTLEPLVASDDDAGIKTSAQSLMAVIDSYTRRNRVSEPPMSEEVARTAEATPEPADAPRLKRRGDEAGAQDKGDLAGERVKSERRDESRGPAIKIEGTQILSGTLAAIECSGASMTLVIKSDAKVLRFSVSDLSNLQFYTQDPKFTPQMRCGPINLPVFIHFKPVPDNQSKFAGDAVAVEFK
ncbi:MAG TPA: tetratricopeptide repeat protein [Blastocatellia bacterium]|nr:tetratricopeptide repeat protein [Blastocatellia bacterium]